MVANDNTKIELSDSIALEILEETAYRTLENCLISAKEGETLEGHILSLTQTLQEMREWEK
jgi:hypothetical protein